MEIAQLKAFVALADLRHFGRAADRLHITQPALTKRLKSLETIIGLQLFERSRRGVSLTKTGEQLLASARHIVEEADALIAHSRRLADGSTGLLEIGFGLSTIELAPRMVTEFRRAFPSVAVTLNDLPSSEQELRLEDQRLDLGFMRLPLSSPILKARAVASDRLALALPVEQEMVDQVIDFERLNRIGFITLAAERGLGLRAQIDRWCRARSVTLRIIQVADDIQTIMALVAAGVGYAIVPQQAARLVSHGVTLLPLEGTASTWDIGLVWHPNNQSPALKRFLRQFEFDRD